MCVSLWLTMEEERKGKGKSVPTAASVVNNELKKRGKHFQLVCVVQSLFAAKLTFDFSLSF